MSACPKSRSWHQSWSSKFGRWRGRQKCVIFWAGNTFLWENRISNFVWVLNSITVNLVDKIFSGKKGIVLMRRTAKLGFFFKLLQLCKTVAFLTGALRGRLVYLGGSTVSKHGCGVTLFWVSQHTLKTFQSFRNTRKFKKKMKYK